MSKALPSKGFSPSWNSQQKNVVRIFNLMAAVDEELSQLDALDWHTFSEEILCSQPVYERFAYFVLYDYEADGKKADEYVEADGDKKRLDGSTAKNYLSTLINLAADKFKANGSAASKQFFNCLDSNSTSEDAKWLRGLKANVVRVHIERAKNAGKVIDKSESKPLILEPGSRSRRHAHDRSPHPPFCCSQLRSGSS